MQKINDWGFLGKECDVRMMSAQFSTLKHRAYIFMVDSLLKELAIPSVTFPDHSCLQQINYNKV